MGNAHQNIVPYHVFRAADEFLIVAVGNDGQFATLLRGPGRARAGPRDARFATNPQRVRHRDLLVGLIAERMRAAHGARVARGASSPRACRAGRSTTSRRCSPIPQVRHRRMQVTAPHPAAGEVAHGRKPDQVLRDADRARRRAAAAGRAHARGAGGRAGLDAAAIERAAPRGIVMMRIDALARRRRYRQPHHRAHRPLPRVRACERADPRDQHVPAADAAQPRARRCRGPPRDRHRGPDRRGRGRAQQRVLDPRAHLRRAHRRGRRGARASAGLRVPHADRRAASRGPQPGRHLRRRRAGVLARGPHPHARAGRPPRAGPRARATP